MAVKKLTVKKSNDLNQANFADFNLSAYRVFLTIISKMQRHNAETGELMQLNLANRECRLTASEYADQFGIDGNTAYEILKLAVDKLLNTQFKIVKLNSKNKKYISKINVCSKADYMVSEGYIDVEFTDRIMPHLAELESNFTMYHLSDIAGFGSIYTTRLYEILMQFKTTGLLKVTVAKLRFELGCTDILKQYNHFKTRVISHAVKEINSKFAMHLSFTEIKTGRFITEIHFNFLAVSHDQVYDVVKQKMRTQVGKHKKAKQVSSANSKNTFSLDNDQQK